MHVLHLFVPVGANTKKGLIIFMKVTAVIAEYNLFHNGHIRQLEYIREHDGEDALRLVIMSGNYVQRGELAVIDKYVRAEAAIRCGADIVLELPYPWSCGSAEYFSHGAVGLYSAIADAVPETEFKLCFGSESGDLHGIVKTAKCLLDEKYISAVENERAIKSDRSESDIRMRDRIFREHFGESMPRCPNDILGTEYIKALMKLDKTHRIVPYTMKREGKETASAARSCFMSRDMQTLSEICPGQVTRLIDGYTAVSSEKIYQAVYMSLIQSGFQEKHTDGMTADLFFRFRKSADKSCGFAELIRRTATKKYTDARLRRVLLHNLFGVTSDELRKTPDYTIVLGLSSFGRRFLASLRGRNDSRFNDSKSNDSRQNDSRQNDSRRNDSRLNNCGRDVFPFIALSQSDRRLDEVGKYERCADKLYALAAGYFPGYFMTKHPYIG